jgi:hypothetical protein
VAFSTGSICSHPSGKSCPFFHSARCPLGFCCSAAPRAGFAAGVPPDRNRDSKASTRASSESVVFLLPSGDDVDDVDDVDEDGEEGSGVAWMRRQDHALEGAGRPRLECPESLPRAVPSRRLDRGVCEEPRAATSEKTVACGIDTAGAIIAVRAISLFRGQRTENGLSSVCMSMPYTYYTLYPIPYTLRSPLPDNKPTRNKHNKGTRRPPGVTPPAQPISLSPLSMSSVSL